MMGAIPRQIRACEKASSKVKDTLSPIFACELYVNSMQPECSSVEELQSFTKNLDEVQKKQFRASSHLLAIAYNEVGYKNLVRLTSWAWTKGFYYKPRVSHEQLMKYKEGLYFTSCCYNSEVGRAFDQGGKDAGFAMIEKQVEMFGKDHYFLEFMLLDFVKQKPYNKFIIDAHEKYKLPLIVSCDCHYCNKEDSKNQSLMLLVQTGRTIAEVQKIVDEDGSQDIFELQDTNLWMKSEEEINEKWEKDYSDVIPYELFCDAKRNTVKICESAKGIQLDRGLKLPVLQDCDEVLMEEIQKGFLRRNLPKSRAYLERLKEEYSLITRKGFSSYFLIQQMMTNEARRVCSKLLGWGDGSQAVGPGRGCLSPEVPIITKNGVLKPIKDIAVGDMVLTRDGTFQKVKNTAVYPIKDETLISLYSWYGDNRGVSLTKDHKVLASKNDSNDLEWFRADEIKVGDFVYMPTPNLKIEDSSDTEDVWEKIGSSSFYGEPKEKLPETIFSLPDNLKWAFLKGFFLSCEKENCANLCDRWFGRQYRLETELLASQFKFLFSTLAIPVFLDNSSIRLPSISFDELKNLQGNYFFKKTENGILLRVSKISERNDIENVHDFEVENNHNYATSSFIVHNSAVGALTCYCLGITNVDPIQEGLLFSRFMSEARGGRSICLEFKNIDPLPPEEVFVD